jgi:hypothetical protein
VVEERKGGKKRSEGRREVEEKMKVKRACRE